MTGLDLSALLFFAGALAVAAISPGPGIAAILARVLGRGRSGMFAFTAGMSVGDVVWLGFAIGGLAVVVQAFHEVLVVIKFAGAAYLLYLAWKLWTAPAKAPDIASVDRRESRTKLFLGGLAVTLGNPKTMVFYLALLPNIVDIPRIDALGFVELSVVTLSVLALVFGGYILIALRARQLITSARAVRAVNRTSGAVMAGAAIAIATR